MIPVPGVYKYKPFRQNMTLINCVKSCCYVHRISHASPVGAALPIRSNPSAFLCPRKPLAHRVWESPSPASLVWRLAAMKNVCKYIAKKRKHTTLSVNKVRGGSDRDSAIFFLYIRSSRRFHSSTLKLAEGCMEGVPFLFFLFRQFPESSDLSAYRYFWDPRHLITTNKLN